SDAALVGPGAPWTTRGAHRSRLGAPARGPGATRARVDVEDARTVVLETADGSVGAQERVHRLGVAFDPEIDGVAGQVVGARRAANTRVVAPAAAGRVDAQWPELLGHLGEDAPQRRGEAVRRGTPADEPTAQIGGLGRRSHRRPEACNARRLLAN